VSWVSEALRAIQTALAISMGAPMDASTVPVMLPIANTGIAAANRVPAFRGSDPDRAIAIANRTAAAKNSASATPTGDVQRVL
jgi:hypothetical protein